MERVMNKFNARKCVIDGITFDSVKEAHRYHDLKLLQRAKIIENLEVHKPYVLIEKSKYGREIRYIADFVYSMNGVVVVEDVKGLKTGSAYAHFRLKKRLMAEKYGIVIKEM